MNGMKTKSLIGIAVLCFLFITASLITVRTFANQSPALSRVVWEYKVEVSPKDKKLNELGAEGWELVAIGDAAMGTVAQNYIFKRAK